MRKNVDELFTVIIEMLQDASSLVKREVSHSDAKLLYKYGIFLCYTCIVYLTGVSYLASLSKVCNLLLVAEC